jgi:Zn-dependent M28 family amino/carboxypeptidase
MIITALLALALPLHAHASDWRGVTPDRHATKKITTPIDPVYKGVFDEVSQSRITEVLKQLTGYSPVLVAGQTYSLTERYTPAGKQHFRAFWQQYFTSLGIPSQELSFSANHGQEPNGHNVEAVLPGKSKDSLVIIVHYDSMGPRGRETSNPAVDDDMTGMATSLETARILAAHKGQLQNTVRFVAADLEEVGGLVGARNYASYLKALSQKEGFKIIAAIDNEQSGWNCAAEDGCGFGLKAASAANPVDVYSCSGDGTGYNNPALGDSLEAVATSYAGIPVKRGCIGENSDHYAMWEIGVPAVVFSEHDPFDNPHFDSEGGDTLDKIDQSYFFGIARMGITFAATVAGLK